MPFSFRNAFHVAFDTAGTALLVTSPVPPLAIITSAVIAPVAFVAGGLASQEKVNSYTKTIESIVADAGDGMMENAFDNHHEDDD
uniref:Uncharacterized protein n=1 Tax=Panagrolaimus sp. JU765 TaxID=591449 RepID=A0AC34RTI6_9BILA